VAVYSRTPLCGATGDEEYVKRLGELLLSELDASYRGLSVAHGGSQVITTYKSESKPAASFSNLRHTWAPLSSLQDR